MTSADPASDEDPHHDPETPGEAAWQMFTHQRAGTVAKKVRMLLFFPQNLRKIVQNSFTY